MIKQLNSIFRFHIKWLNWPFLFSWLSILGPVLFNLYVNDLSEALPSNFKSHQYADDTTIYRHCIPSDLQSCQTEVQAAIDKLSNWSKECNLALNPKKTKVMLLSTAQMARFHRLDEISMNLSASGRGLERVTTFRLLGTQLHANLCWKDEIKSKISSCYGTLSVIRKLKHLAPYHVRKQLAETLVLSKLDHNDVVSEPLPEYLLKRMQRVQLAAASFVIGRFADVGDIAKLGWLPIRERRQYRLLCMTFKALNFDDWPSYLKVKKREPGRNLRSSGTNLLEVPLESMTFQHSASKLFNRLPQDLRTTADFNFFRKEVRRILKDGIL